MGAFSVWHLLIVAFVILIMFGAGKLPNVMKDLATGMREVKKVTTEAEEAARDLRTRG